MSLPRTTTRRRRAAAAAAAAAAVLLVPACGTASAAPPDDADIEVIDSPPAEHEHGGPADLGAEEDDGASPPAADEDEAADEEEDEPAAEAPPALEPLATDCDDSDLPAHDGFQQGPRCAETAFGEVGAAADNPTLLITDAPDEVGVDEPFELEVSTRNLVRDRFLPAAQGGYYLESSVLTAEGLQRGHFHVACRMLASTGTAPDPAPVPAFFKGVEDGGGGAAPDTVTVEVPGLPDAGVAQCAAWAGDGSHRIPMMQRANQVPAFDAVRVEVG